MNACIHGLLQYCVRRWLLAYECVFVCRAQHEHDNNNNNTESLTRSFSFHSSSVWVHLITECVHHKTVQLEHRRRKVLDNGASFF